MNRRFYRLCRNSLLAALSLLLGIGSLTSCFDEQAPGTYYTFTGNSVADFLEANSDQFGTFIEVLKRAQIWGELDTYGTYTCFAPVNSGFEAYLAQKGISSVSELTKEECDTIAWTHLIRKTMFLTDMVSGVALPQVNLNDRFLTLTCDSIPMSIDTSRFKLRYCINKNCHVIEADDTVQNGVIQVLDSVIRVTGDYVFDIVKMNPDLSIFFEALNLVGLEDSLKEWRDETYTIGYDSVNKGIQYEGGSNSYYQAYYPNSIYTNFTILVEPNKVYRSKGINNIDDLEQYAESVYQDAYIDEGIDVSQYRGQYTNRLNALNMFVSYHILPFGVPASTGFNCRSDIVEDRCLTQYIDPEDYFETYLPHSLIRVSTVTEGGNAGTYINRRGLGPNKQEFTDKPNVRGIKILPVDKGPAQELREARNGFVHYLDDILVYSREVRQDVLNRRIRVDCATLSPDFITSGARQKQGTSGNQEATAFKSPKYFKSYTKDYILAVRVAGTTNWSYEGDGVDLNGQYDLALKLPPIPYSGVWELRLSYRGYVNCGVVQNYVGTSLTTLEPCGLPTDLRLDADQNPNIQWKSDESLEDEGGEEAVIAWDKAMRNRGYMKGPDSHSNGETPMRDINTMARRIITRAYFSAGQTYYLRMKMVNDNPKGEMNFDYMEWCPKSVYDNGEDRH